MNNPKTKNSFAVTLTLTPEFCDKTKTNLQYELTFPALNSALAHLAALEYSIHTELTKDNNIHYHVFIRMQNRTKCDDLKVNLLGDLYSNEGYLIWGFACVKKCYDVEGWINYLKKNPYVNNQIYLF